MLAEKYAQLLQTFFQAMRYLSYALYPLLVAGAVYSLIYYPHKRYSMISILNSQTRILKLWSCLTCVYVISL